MKSKILLIAAMSALFVTKSFAGAENLGLMSVIPAATRTNLASPLLIEAPKQANLALSTYITSAAVASNLFYYFAPTTDGSTYDTNNMYVWNPTVQAGVWGTNTYSTNFNIGGYYGLFLVGVSNGHAAASITNTVKYNVKHER